MQDNAREADLERKLESWAVSQSDAELRPEAQRKILDLLTSSLTPVKPLPSQGWLVLTFLAAFAACAAGLIAVMDKAGFHLMSKAQMGWMAAILAGGGILFSLTLAWQMVPGSSRSLPLSLVLALSGIGVIGGIAKELDLSLMLIKRLTHTGSTLRSRTPAEKAQLIRSLEEQVWPLLAAGTVKPLIYQTFPLAQACQAHELMDSGKHIGKIVLTMDAA